MTKSITIRQDLMINRGCRIHDLTLTLEFSTMEQFASYKQTFYKAIVARGWKRSSVSANQCHKGNLTMTPFFILG